MSRDALRDFARDYAAHRAAEGRLYAEDALLGLPYLRHGPLARQWGVRARSFEALLGRIIRPLAASLGRGLQLLDLGAGNGWLSYRVALEGHDTTALDIRSDKVDGLGAAAPFLERSGGRMQTLDASFDAIPMPDASFDIAVFNASLHYATNLGAVLAEAARAVRPGGRLVILDSPFYRHEADGLVMVAEKLADAPCRFGAHAETLMSLPFIEFLTRERLAAASAPIGCAWRRSRVRYPLWYEIRPVVARLRRARAPSRFDLWSATRP
ncbi:class I SAM-dependent methyltransferase [Gluconacetobacter asukensis]|uniref:Class I SAM-dependent methyltransferase n=1 Tax=Gluconacetobacter asukensis TaxID=1017181 RepID=A0A7W4J238_9PROT|nr:class I SAM-dependent methyltransferase [Gluconacetobacter asukensis]MBB2173102.1 class I SAM-dependent methyltransferase [Gluconacetobacter asukensis]